MKRFLILLTVVQIGMALYAEASHATDMSNHSIHAAVQRYIETNMPWAPETVRVEFLSEEITSPAHHSNSTLRIEPAGNQDYIGDMSFLVRMYKGGGLIKTETVRTRIAVLRDIVVAARSLPAGTVLNDSDVKTIQRWVRRIHPQSLSPIESTTGKRLTTQLPLGAEILATMLKEIPLVRRGKVVRMVFNNGLMHIVTVGLSEEDGVAGNIVRVKNITSNKIIYARVLSDSVVGIEF